MHILLTIGFVLFGIYSAYAQGIIKNPTAVAFICPDHATDIDHEVDIIREADGVVIQTLLVGDPPEINGEVVVPINVQPVAFGQYRFVVRAVAGMVRSADSERSPVWERAPGRPTGVQPR